MRDVMSHLNSAGSLKRSWLSNTLSNLSCLFCFVCENAGVLCPCLFKSIGKRSRKMFKFLQIAVQKQKVGIKWLSTAWFKQTIANSSFAVIQEIPSCQSQEVKWKYKQLRQNTTAYGFIKPMQYKLKILPSILFSAPGCLPQHILFALALYFASLTSTSKRAL